MIGFDFQSFAHDVLILVGIGVGLYCIPYLIKRGWETGRLHAHVYTEQNLRQLVEKTAKQMLAAQAESNKDPDDRTPPGPIRPV